MSALLWLAIATGGMAVVILTCDWIAQKAFQISAWWERERVIAKNSYVATQREVRRLQARRRIAYPDRRFRSSADE